ncbi:hypothetical protein BJ170DRAFT_629676 [Xylariales sp. AK1849]|nr:hypothetical protein BJ170DRAFT_629676 [Xylariales sp. AK1849]
MKASVIFALIPAVLAAPNVIGARQVPATTTTSSTTTSSTPCPTPPVPSQCADKPDVYMVCMNQKLWCRYTDPTYHTPAFVPTDDPCPACMPSNP